MRNFLNKDIISQLPSIDKILLVLTWVLLGLSVLFGIRHLWVTYNFFKERAGLHSFLVDKLSNDNEIIKIKEEINILSEETEKKMNEIYEGIVDKLIYEKAKEMALESFPNILPDPPGKYIKLQTFLIIISIGLLVYIMAKILL